MQLLFLDRSRTRRSRMMLVLVCMLLVGRCTVLELGPWLDHLQQFGLKSHGALRESVVAKATVQLSEFSTRSWACRSAPSPRFAVGLRDAFLNRPRIPPTNPARS